MPRVPILAEREQVRNAGDPARHGRPRARRRLQLEHPARGHAGARGARGRRRGRAAGTRSGAAASPRCSFRKLEPVGQYVGITDRPSYADAREIAHDLVAAYIDEKLDRVDIIYNSYISPLTQRVTREVLLPVQRGAR